ncbi:MAG: WD40 repeat domain-containing protein [Anaerolineaceae bacterium]
MSTSTLYDAIALVRAGKNEEARQNLFDIIRNDSQNEMAWMWLAETLNSDIDRMKVLKACAKVNPDSKIAKMAITKLQEKFNNQEIVMPPESPFLEDATYDPNLPERTGHTGAIIGFDGSFILSDVSDFDDIIDLRTGSHTYSTEPVESKEQSDVTKTFTAPDQISSSTDSEIVAEPPLDAKTDVPTTPIRRLYPENEELNYEPDLSNYLKGEIDESPSTTLPPANRVPLYKQKDDVDDQLNKLDDLSIEELGFSDEDTVIGDNKSNVPFINQRPFGDLLEDDLIEDHVIQNDFEENAKRRKKRERSRLLILIVGIFAIIAILCGVLYFLLSGFSFGLPKNNVPPTQLILPTQTLAPTVTNTLMPTVTNTPQPTFTPTAIPTPTALVEISEKAISQLNANAIILKLDQPLKSKFFKNLDGNLVAIADGKSIRVWNLATGEIQVTLSGHNDLVTDAVFSDDDKFLVSGAKDFSIILWDLTTGNAVKTFGMDANTINRIYGDRTKRYPTDVTVDFSPDGSALAAGAFGIVNILDIPSGVTRGTFSLSDEALKIAAQDLTNLRGFKVKFDESGWVLSAAMSKNLVGLDTVDAALLYQYELGSKGQVTYSVNRTILVEADTGGVTVRHLLDGAVINGFGGRKVKPNQAPPDFVLTEDGSLLGIETDARENEFELALWDVEGDTGLMNFKGICISEVCKIPAYALYPAGDQIIVSRQGNDDSIEVILVDLQSHEILFRLDALQGGVKSLAFSPDGHLAAGLDGTGKLYVWNMENGDELVSKQSGSPDYVEFSRDGQFIYGWNSTTLFAWGNP